MYEDCFMKTLLNRLDISQSNHSKDTSLALRHASPFLQIFRSHADGMFLAVYGTIS